MILHIPSASTLLYDIKYSIRECRYKLREERGSLKAMESVKPASKHRVTIKIIMDAVKDFRLNPANVFSLCLTEKNTVEFPTLHEF